MHMKFRRASRGLSLFVLSLLFISSCSEGDKLLGGNKTVLKAAYDASQAEEQMPSVKVLSVKAREKTTSGAYVVGDTITFEVELDESVDIITTNGVPQLKLNIGGVTKLVDYVSGSGGKTLIFDYTVASGDFDADGIEVTSIDLNSGTAQGESGSDVNLELAKPIVIPLAAKVDAKGPVIQSVSSGDQTYGTGELISFTVTFDETVDVIGTPKLTFDVGGTSQSVDYVSGSGSKELVFTKYTVALGDFDADGIEATSISLNSGTIKDELGNDAELTTANGQTLAKVDAKGPVIQSVSSDDQTYVKKGDGIAFTVTFDETVDVDTNSGKPLLKVTIGNVTKDATYDSGSGSKVLVFKYQVASGDVDSDGIEATSISSNPGTITDKAGNAADLTMVNGQTPAKVDAAVKVINVTSTPGIYASGDKIKVLVQFSDSITVVKGSGITIDLNIGGSVIKANYTVTDPSDTMVFTASVDSGVAVDLDGIEVVTNSIQKGTSASIQSSGVDVEESFAKYHLTDVKVKSPFDFSGATDIWFDSTDTDADGDSTDQSAGDAVKTFYDKSGKDNHITSGTNGGPEVTLDAGNNSNLSVYFDGTVDDLLVSTKNPNLSASGYTYFTAFNAAYTSQHANYLFSTRSVSSGVAMALQNGSFYLLSYGSPKTSILNMPSVENSSVFLSDTNDPSSSRILNLGGEKDQGKTHQTGLTVGPLVAMGGYASQKTYFSKGYVNEVLYFNRALTLAERAIVENYLGAKWKSPHSTRDYYEGDDSSKGDYDYDVTGILKLSSLLVTDGVVQTLPASEVSASRSGALLIANGESDGFLKDVGDRVFVGSKSVAMTTAELPSSSSVSTVISNRVWYLDVSDATSNGGKISMEFTPSLMGFGWKADAASYELLWRPGTSGPFQVIATASETANNAVTFNDIVINTSANDADIGTARNVKSGYIALGLKDAVAPSLRYAEVTGDKEITLTFDESVSLTASSPSGFSVSGVTISSTSVEADKKVVLTTDNTLQPASTVSYSGTGVSDIASNALTSLSNVVVGTSGIDTITLTSSSIVVAGAGDDAITASSGSDVFDYNFITDGNDTISGFNKDKIDLSDLLQYSNGQDISKFVAVSDDGTNTTINVDAHGRGNTSAATRDISITLSGVTGSTLESLINDGVLVVTAP